MNVQDEAINWLEGYLGTIVHDLRGPLSVVAGHAQMLRRMCEAKVPYEKMRPGIEAIARSALKMSAILDEISGRVSEQAEALQPEQVEVEELLTHALRGDRGRFVCLEVDPGLPPVWVIRPAEELRIATLLGIVTAGRRGPVTTRVTRHGKMVRITVEDVWLDLPVA